MWTSSKLFKIVIGIVVVFTFVISVICFIDAGWSYDRFKSAFSKNKLMSDHVTHEPYSNENIIDHMINDTSQMISENELEYNRVFKFLKYLQPRLSDEIANEFTKQVIKQAKLKGFPPELICALIFIESSCIPEAISPTNHGDGPMQVNTDVHIILIESLGHTREDMFKIGPNIEVGCSILREYYNKTHSIRKALKRYVGGNEVKYVLDILALYVDSQIDIPPKKKHKLSQKRLTYNKTIG